MILAFLIIISIFTISIYIKLSTRLQFINEITKIDKLQIDLKDDVSYYLLVDGMINYEIETIMKYKKIYGSKKFKCIVIDEYEYQYAHTFQPNFICKYNINLIPTIITKKSDDTFSSINPHKENLKEKG